MTEQSVRPYAQISIIIIYKLIDSQGRTIFAFTRPIYAYTSMSKNRSDDFPMFSGRCTEANCEHVFEKIIEGIVIF